LLVAFANQAAVAIDNARLFRQIRDHLAEITEMKTLMDNVFESIASGVITIDEADRIALYNRAAEQILGIPASSIVHEAYAQALTLLSLPVESVVQDVKENGGTHNLEMDVTVQQRPSTTTLNMTFSPLRNSGQESTLGVAMVLDDISEKKRLESVRRYLPPALVDKVRDIDAAQRPQRRDITVLFADIRGFSTFSEHFDPRQLIQILNGYFTEAVQAITFYQGLTDKFTGDAVMALFNTPLNPQTDHVERAVRTALMMSANLMAHRQRLPAAEWLHFGVGIHTGEAVVGNVGSDLRKDYSAIGDAVNLAKRLQETAQPDQIIISQDVHACVTGFAQVRVLPLVQVKGRQAFEQTYELLGVQ
jgi:PAS domain S-box-containing protein